MRSLLLLSALLSAGCASAPFEGVPPTDEPPTPEDITADDLADARAAWEASGAEDYAMVLTRGCFCPPEWRGPYEVRVDGGDVVSVTYEGENLPTDRALSIDAMFDLLDDAFEQDAETVRAAFDAETGAPLSLWVDYEALMADEEVGYTVQSLRPL